MLERTRPWSDSSEFPTTVKRDVWYETFIIIALRHFLPLVAVSLVSLAPITAPPRCLAPLLHAACLRPCKHPYLL